MDFSNTIFGMNSYYPGGMVMPDRSFSYENYVFGFNGKLKDEELSGSGNSYDFGDRLYNPRLVRWNSPDVLEGKYPRLSTYSFCGNNPIIFKDYNSKDWVITTHYDLKTGYTIINITVNAKIVNLSSKSIDMDKLVANYKSDVEKLFTGSDVSSKLSWNMEFNIQQASYDAKSNTLYNVKPTDHLIEIKNGDKFSGKNVAGYGEVGGMRISLNADWINESGSTLGAKSILSHELGHTGGFVHPFELPNINLDKDLNLNNGVIGEIGGQRGDYNSNSLNYNFMNYQDAFNPLDWGQQSSKLANNPDGMTLGQLGDLVRNSEKQGLNRKYISTAGRLVLNQSDKDKKK